MGDCGVGLFGVAHRGVLDDDVCIVADSGGEDDRQCCVFSWGRAAALNRSGDAACSPVQLSRGRRNRGSDCMALAPAVAMVELAYAIRYGGTITIVE